MFFIVFLQVTTLSIIRIIYQPELSPGAGAVAEGAGAVAEGAGAVAKGAGAVAEGAGAVV